MINLDEQDAVDHKKGRLATVVFCLVNSYGTNNLKVIQHIL